MNCKYILLLSAIAFFCMNKNVFSMNNKINDTISIGDSIINISLLEVQDSSFLHILDKITKYKDEKMNVTQKNAEFFAAIKISYYGCDIHIETISYPFVVSPINIIPKGIISIGEYDYLFYDPYNIAPFLIKQTNSYRSYEYRDKFIPVFREFDTWCFKMVGDEIQLDEFHIEEDCEDLFLEMFEDSK